MLYLENLIEKVVELSYFLLRGKSNNTSFWFFLAYPQAIVIFIFSLNLGDDIDIDIE